VLLLGTAKLSPPLSFFKEIYARPMQFLCAVALAQQSRLAVLQPSYKDGDGDAVGPKRIN